MVEIPYTLTQFFKSKNQLKSMKKDSYLSNTCVKSKFDARKFLCPKRKFAFARDGLVKVTRIKHMIKNFNFGKKMIFFCHNCVNSL